MPLKGNVKLMYVASAGLEEESLDPTRDQL